MIRSLIILGTGGSVYDVLDVVEAINIAAPTWRVAGFLDDNRSVGSRYLGIEVLGPLTAARRFENCEFVNVIGSDKSFRNRPEILAAIDLPTDRFATLVHPAAGVSSRAKLGRGTYVNYGASVAGNVTIGDQVSVGPGCIIGHDTLIDDYAMLAPGAVVSGHVHVGRNSYIGAASVLRQHVRIGEQALVGMGAVVVRDVADDCTVVGNPARTLEIAHRHSDTFSGSHKGCRS
jgi:sugar O-acyltransferase (sialic acid O-acetyltransferase NeuD family)